MTHCLTLALLVVTAPPADGGTVRGRVTWVGDVPVVPPLVAPIPAGSGYRFDSKPNPFAPSIKDGAMGGVAVFLRHVPSNRSKPWPYQPASIEQAGYELKVRQGDGPPAAVGFARVGDKVTVVTRDPGPETIRLRGEAFTTLPFPGPNQPVSRTFDTPGVVEVTSGTMLAWAACDLIVCDHPYHTLTATDGKFELTAVPPGEYTLVCRVRNWRITGQDRDPETGLVSRRRYALPAELAAPVRVTAAGVADHTFTVTSDLVSAVSPKR